MTDAENHHRVLITGAAGNIGTVLRAGLPAHGWVPRSFDLTAVADPAPGEQTVVGDVTDADAVHSAMDGVAAVVHLAGIAGEAPYDEIRRVNIDGTHQVFDAARLAGVRRVVFASSNHAVGFAGRTHLLPAEIPPRPDTFYGLSKAFGEALGQLYADRYGMDVVALRIGSFRDLPSQPRHLSTWLSPEDCVRLVHAALSAHHRGFAAVYGISANTRGWWDHTPGHALGYHAEDDAEEYAEEILAEHGEIDRTAVEYTRVGGEYCRPEFDVEPIRRLWESGTTRR